MRRTRLSLRTASSLWRSCQRQFSNQYAAPLPFGDRRLGKRLSSSDRSDASRSPPGSRPGAPCG
jgi:hypothetical protein